MSFKNKFWKQAIHLLTLENTNNNYGKLLKPQNIVEFWKWLLWITKKYSKHYCLQQNIAENLWYQCKKVLKLQNFVDHAEFYVSLKTTEKMVKLIKLHKKCWS